MTFPALLLADDNAHHMYSYCKTRKLMICWKYNLEYKAMEYNWDITAVSLIAIIEYGSSLC